MTMMNRDPNDQLINFGEEVINAAAAAGGAPYPIGTYLKYGYHGFSVATGVLFVTSQLRTMTTTGKKKYHHRNHGRYYVDMGRNYKIIMGGYIK